MNDVKLIQERQKAELSFREYEAILVLTNQMTAVRRLEYVKKREMMDYLEKKELRQFSKKVNSEILHLRNYYGAKVPNSVMVDYLEKIESGLENKI